MKNTFFKLLAITILVLIFSFNSSYCYTGAWVTVTQYTDAKLEEFVYLTPTALNVDYELHISWNYNTGRIYAEATLNDGYDDEWSWVESARADYFCSPDPIFGETGQILSGAWAYAYAERKNSNATICSWAFYSY